MQKAYLEKKNLNIEDYTIIGKKFEDMPDYMPFGCATHSHNYYIQLLAETGLVGFLFLFSIFLIISSIILMNIFQKHNLLNDPSLSILICFFINLFPFLPSGNFFHNWLCIVMFIPLPFYFFIKEK